MMASTIVGISDLVQKMSQLEDSIKVKVGRKMVASGAGVIKRQAKANIQAKGLIKSKALLNNIAIKRESKAPKDTIQYNIGVRHGKYLGRKAQTKLVRKKGRVTKRYVNDPFYWSFIEFGRNVYKGAGESSGKAKRKVASSKVPAQRFLSKAFDEKQTEALSQMERVLDKELLKAR